MPALLLATADPRFTASDLDALPSVGEHDIRFQPKVVSATQASITLILQSTAPQCLECSRKHRCAVLIISTANAAGARAPRPLEMFFPFDPYLLPRSARFLNLEVCPVAVTGQVMGDTTAAVASHAAP